MIRIALPYPPARRSPSAGGDTDLRLSPAYRRWCDRAGSRIQPPAAPIAGPFRLSIALRRRSVRDDLDQRAKAVLACLEHHGVIRDANLCAQLCLHWNAGLPAACIVLLEAGEGAP
ncbi:UNVERIFIED_ORG: hypothetical protein LHK14_01690 [Roseateles sp. XES5]|nr:hypothetical protein [Roseateles sp. XES5]